MSVRPIPPQPFDPNPKFRVKRAGQGWSDWYSADLALDVLGAAADVKAVEIRETMSKDQYLVYLRKFAI